MKPVMNDRKPVPLFTRPAWVSQAEVSTGLQWPHKLMRELFIKVK